MTTRLRYVREVRKTTEDQGRLDVIQAAWKDVLDPLEEAVKLQFMSSDHSADLEFTQLTRQSSSKCLNIRYVSVKRLEIEVGLKLR